MRYVKFNPDEDLNAEQKTDWDRWVARAEKATETAIANWEKSRGKEKPKLNKNIWKDLKTFLQDNKIFQEKCAYCESRYMAVAHGDAEHFRPKKGIVNKDDEGKELPPETTRDVDGRSIEHPGYFWLAYHWKNLLPACEKCNSDYGKMNQFPVKNELVYLVKLTEKQVDRLKQESRAPRASQEWPGYYYPEPDHLDELEGRLLLHPYKDQDTGIHLVFDMKGEALACETKDGISEQGEQSIKVYNLCRKRLNDYRHEAQRDRFKKFMYYYIGLDNEDEDEGEEIDTEKIAREWLRRRLPKWEYSAAISDYCDYKIKKLFRSRF